MRIAQSLPSFHSMSQDLRPFIEAYDPGWRSPQDAMARRFYHWSSSE
jgi:cyclase